MMLRVVAPLAVALFLLQFFDATETAAVGLRSDDPTQSAALASGLEALSPTDGSAVRSIEGKDINERMKKGDDQKPNKLLRFIFWLKELIMWPIRKIIGFFTYIFVKVFDWLF